MGTVKRRGVEMQAPLPSTFRDHRRSHNGINYIFYGWKLTAEMKGLLKKNKKFYLPILVLPLSQRHHQMPLEPTPGLPGYAHASQGVSAFRELPQGWKFERLESRIKKGLIFSRGRIELKVSLRFTSVCCGYRESPPRIRPTHKSHRPLIVRRS